MMFGDGEVMFEEIIVHVGAWRRLRDAFIKKGKTEPKYKDLCEDMVKLMDLVYDETLADLKKQKESLQHDIEKARKNTEYGKVDE